MSRTMVKILFFSSLVLFSSCVSIPKQTAEMSVLLEQQLDALKQANNSIIENVYKEKEKNITDYVDNVWFPQYLEEYFQKPIIQEAWNEAVNTDSLEYRLELIQTLTQICMEEYKTYKESLLSPIYAEKDTILRNFNEQYDLALKMNSIITRNVKSASDLQSEYKSYLNKIVSTEKLDSITQSSLDKIDKQFDNVIEGFDKYDKYEDKIKDLCSFAFLRCYENGSPILELDKDEFISDYPTCRVKENRPGDMAEVYVTDKLRKYKFPEIKDERFMSEDVVWISMGIKYKTVYINKAIYQGGYLAGGLTANDKPSKFASPIGSMYRGVALMHKECGIKANIKGAIIYDSIRLRQDRNIRNQ